MGKAVSVDLRRRMVRGVASGKSRCFSKNWGVRTSFESTLESSSRHHVREFRNLGLFEFTAQCLRSSGTMIVRHLRAHSQSDRRPTR